MEVIKVNIWGIPYSDREKVTKIPVIQEFNLFSSTLAYFMSMIMFVILGYTF